MAKNGFDAADFMVGNIVFLLVLGLVIYGICGGVAAVVAPERRRLRFFLLTLFFLGPLGVGFAAIAPPGVPALSDHWEFQCDCCGAFQERGTRHQDRRLLALR